MIFGPAEVWAHDIQKLKMQGLKMFNLRVNPKEVLLNIE